MPTYLIGECSCRIQDEEIIYTEAQHCEKSYCHVTFAYPQRLFFIVRLIANR